jgi:hypothetical protein
MAVIQEVHRPAAAVQAEAALPALVVINKLTDKGRLEYKVLKIIARITANPGY